MTDASDNPPCVSQVLRRFKMRLNDCEWSSPEARAAGLRRLAVAQLGSALCLDDIDFARRVSTLVKQKYVARSTLGDKILSEFAEEVVQILIEMDAPGCRWLYLTEK